MTKIYILEASYGLMGGLILGFTLSRKEAEYLLWKEEKKNRGGYSMVYYTIREISFLPENREKDYKDFVKHRAGKIKEEMSSKRNCAEKDESKIKELEEELKSYE